MLAGLVARGHRIGCLARMDDDALATLFFEDNASLAVAEEALSGTQTEPSRVGLIEQVVEALGSVDSAAVEQLLTPALLSLGPRRFTLTVALPLLREVGDRWAAGTLSVAAEHAAVAVLRTLLGGAIQRRPECEPVRRALFVTPVGQRHEFGVLAAALLASGLGVDPIYLGTDLPASEVASAAERTDAGLVVVGLAPRSNDVTREIAYLRSLRGSLPDRVDIWVGGGCADEVAGALGLVAVPSLEDFETRIGGRTRSLTSQTTAPSRSER
jgi:methanogenic corrinoid protein MtbC1